MYSRTVCQQRLDAIPGIVFEDLSIDECRQRSAAIDALMDPDTGKLSRALTLEERAWTKHEQARCTADFRYWSTRYAKINDKANRLVDFTPNIAQNIILDMWSELEEQQLAIMMLQLKARQAGVTTLTELAIAHRVQFYPDVNAVVASADVQKSDKMAGIIRLAWDHEPWFLMPERTRNTLRLVEFGKLNSGLSVQHGAQMSGIARGTTPSVVHLSEVASFIDGEILIEASILRAFHETPWHFFIQESTADGLYGYWPKKWREARDGWPQQRSRFMPAFLPWFISRDLYPTEAWLRKQPIPNGWEPTALVKAHAERARLYVASEPRLRKYLGFSWRMPIDQQWYYEAEYESARASRRLNLFLQEMPADENEAFQASNESAFDQDVVTMYANETSAKPPWGVFGFECSEDLLGRKHQASLREIDPSRPKIRIRAGTDRDPVDMLLVPLKFEGYTVKDGRFYVWLPPNVNDEFGMGVDTAYGVGEDETVCEVLKKATLLSGPEQAAEFASAYMSADTVWPIALAIATWYSPTGRQCRATIECRGTGDGTQIAMRKHGWSNFHPWVHYDNRRIRPREGAKIGWYTNAATRQLLMDWIISALNDRWLVIHSPFFVNQMKALSRDEFKQSFRADYGGHDDRILALGMILVSMHILDVRGFRYRRMGTSEGDGAGVSEMVAQGDAARVMNDVVDAVYDPGMQGRDMRDTGQVARYLRRLSGYRKFPGARRPGPRGRVF